ncbi:unnamed protein product [Somion occarium]|uniref:Uncharacterized protein n=1 Tax=Somion occarium TaxID=3059160 RepID=A0ABP1E5Z9_9APHY
MSKPNLKDADGSDIFDGLWYKIMLSDGTELGFGPLVNSRLSCGPKPPGQGMIFRYFRYKGNDTVSGYGWPSGDIGYFKGLGMGTDGKEYRQYLSLSNGVPPVLAWYDKDDSYGFTGTQIPGNRIALYAKDQTGATVGLRGETESVSKEAVAFYGQRSQFPICLDCSFVPIPVGNTDVGPFF